MKTRARDTFYILNARFTTPAGAADIAGMNDYFITCANSERAFMDEVRNPKSRRKIYSLVWEQFLQQLNFLLSWYECEGTYCTGEQVKKWLSEKGTSYTEALRDSIIYYQDERREAAEEATV